MTLKIVRGRQQSPARIVLYGVEGIGKTTLASEFPDPVILDTEDGSNQLDVARVRCDDFGAIEAAMHELVRDRQGFRTVVVDSADWAERLLIDQIVRHAGKKSIEDFGFGKGFVMVAERIGKFLGLADMLVAAGMHVVFVAHAQVKRTSPPDMQDGFDRYELKMTKQTAPLFKEWADALLFANYKTKLVEGNDGRMKAIGGKDRVLFTDHSAAWDAKNRYGLAPEIPMSIDALAPVLVAAAKPRWLERVAAAATVADLGLIADEAEAAESRGDLTAAQAKKLDEAIARRHNELEPVHEGATA